MAKEMLDAGEEEEKMEVASSGAPKRRFRMNWAENRNRNGQF